MALLPTNHIDSHSTNIVIIAMVTTEFTPCDTCNQTFDTLQYATVARSEPNRGGITLQNIETVSIAFSIGVIFLCGLTFALYLYNKKKPFRDPEDPENLEPSVIWTKNYGTSALPSRSGGWTNRSIHAKGEATTTMGSAIELGLLRRKDAVAVAGDSDGDGDDDSDNSGNQEQRGSEGGSEVAPKDKRKNSPSSFYTRNRSPKISERVVHRVMNRPGARVSPSGTPSILTQKSPVTFAIDVNKTPT